MSLPRRLGMPCSSQLEEFAAIAETLQQARGEDVAEEAAPVAD
ncbi:hypothetical protein [Streptomyces sp. NPDC059781]